MAVRAPFRGAIEGPVWWTHWGSADVEIGRHGQGGQGVQKVVPAGQGEVASLAFPGNLPALEAAALHALQTGGR